MLTNYVKRILSFALALVMVLGMLPAQVFATEEEIPADHEHCEVCLQHDCICPPEEVPQEEQPPVEVTPTEPEAPAEQPALADWTEEMLAVQDLIDEYIEYYLGYYGFVTPEGELTEAHRAQIEDIVVNSMDANERENARMAVEEVEGSMMYYLEEGLLTGEQCITIVEANPALLVFADVIYAYATAPDMLAGDVTSNVNVSGLSVTYTNSAGGSSLGEKGTATCTGSANKINVTAKSGLTFFIGGSIATSTVTVTLKNTGYDNAVLSFTYGAPSGGTATIQTTGTSVGSGSNQSFVLTKNQTVTVTLTSSSSDRTAYNLSLSNVQLTEAKSATASFKAPTGGTYTVDGASITADTAITNLTTKVYSLVATPNSGASFAGWVDENNKILSTSASDTLVLTENTVVRALFAENGGAAFAIGTTVAQTYSEKYTLLVTLGDNFNYHTVTKTHLYTDLQEAIDAANSSTSKAIVLMNNGTISGNYTIPSGVSLLIPCDDVGTMATTQPLCKGLIGVPSATITAYKTLTMAPGSSITVAEGGAMNVNAVLFAIGGSDRGGGSPLGGYGYVNMQEGSNITVQNGGGLYTYGYINGAGTVTVKSGGKVYEVFQYEDFRGGTVTSDVAQDTDHGVFPLSDYYVQNVMVPLTLEAGATEGSYASLHMNNATFGTGVEFISSKNAMFNLLSGSVTKRYDAASDRLIFEVNGDVEIAGINMGISDIKMSSSDFVLPINSNMTIYLNSGNLSVQQEVALLPGAEVYISEGAKCTLVAGGALYLYDSENWGPYVGPNKYEYCPCYYVPGRGIITTTDVPASYKKDAQIVVEGSVSAIGNVFTTSGGAAIKGTEGAVIYMTPAASGVTYQYDQTNFYEFSLANGKLAPAMLQNVDGSYYKTSDTPKDADGNYITGYYIYENGYWHYRCLNNVHTEGPAATCGTPQVCTVCGYEIKAATGEHTPGAAATCTTAQICTVCNKELKSALGHTYTTVQAVADTCEEGVSGYKESYICGRDGCGLRFAEKGNPDSVITDFEAWKQGEGKVDDAQHSWGGWTQTDAATCVKVGSQTHTCSVCQKTESEEIPRLSHKAQKAGGAAATCGTSGVMDHWFCTECNFYYKDEACSDDQRIGDAAALAVWKAEGGEGYIPGLAHDIQTIEEVAAKCDAFGVKAHYYCNNCKTYYTTKDSDTQLSGKIENIETWKTTAGLGQINKLPHDMETVAAVKDTCLAAGHNEYLKCKNCPEESGKVVGTQLSHEADGISRGAAPTCTADGWNNYYMCKNGCQTFYADPECTKPIGTTTAEVDAWRTGDGKIGKQGHNLQTVEGKAATCTEDGIQTYYVCDRDACGMIFQDSEGKTPVENLESWKVIPKLGHTPVETPAVEAKCDAFGTKAYYYCETCELYFATKVSEKELTDLIGDEEALKKWLDTLGDGKVPMTTHEWEVIPAKAATCQADGYSSYRDCKNCDAEADKVVAPQLSHEADGISRGAAPTCTADGWNNYYMCKNGCGLFYADPECKNLIGDADAVMAWRDGDGKIGMLGHHMVLVPAVDPVCETQTPGVKAHYVCMADAACENDDCDGRTVFCGAGFLDDENKTPIENLAAWKADSNLGMIPASHTKGETKIEEDDAGKKWDVVYCAVCKLEMGRTEHTEILEHTDKKEYGRVEATCTAPGRTAGWECTDVKCPVCQGTGKEGLVEIPQLAHQPNKGMITLTIGATEMIASAPCTLGCGQNVEEFAAFTVKTVEATCAKPDTTTYTATFPTFGEQTKTETGSVVGHNWGAIEYVWAENEGTWTCTATQKCSYEEGANCTRSAQATVETTVVNVTCLTDGKIVYTASFAGKAEWVANDQANWPAPKEIKTETAVGHHTWKFDGTAEDLTWDIANEDALTCTADLVCTKCAEGKMTDVVSSSVVKNSKAPTCTAAGEDAYTAYFNVDGQELTAVKLVAVDALNHKWGEVKYTFFNGEEEIQTIIGATDCTATRTCEHDGSHVETETVNVVVAGNDATCQAGSEKTYTATFTTNAAFVEQKATESLARLDHQVTFVAEKSSTCKDTGVAEHYECSVCHLLFKSEEDAKNDVRVDKETAVAEGGLKMPTVGHDLEYTYNNDATCLADGTNTVTCKFDCDAYKDKTETAPGTKLDHEWGEYVYDAGSATCKEDGTKTAYCTYACGTPNTITAEGTKLEHNFVLIQVTKPATCEGVGYKEEKCENGCNATKTVQIPALGHNYVWVDGQAPTCVDAGWNGYFQCVEGTENTDGRTVFCEAYFDAEKNPIADLAEWKAEGGAGYIQANGHDYNEVVTEPTCNDQGYTTYTCKNCAEGTVGHSYVGNYVDAKGHRYGEGYYANDEDEPTCTEDGLLTYACSVCAEDVLDHFKTEVDPKTGHNGKFVEGQAATCTINGWNSYYQCQNACGLFYKDENCTEVIGNGDALTAWRDGEGKLNALGHELVEIEGLAATCDAAGYLTHYQCAAVTRSGERTYYCGNYFAEATDTAATATPIAVKGDLEALEAWKTTGAGAIAKRECVDVNPKDHVCDYADCGKRLSECSDATDDEDHLCDYCKETVGDHAFTNGVCNCGYVQDLKVSLTIKAAGQSKDVVVPVEDIKYGNGGQDFTMTLDLETMFGSCFTIQSVSATIGGEDVESTKTGNTLTITSGLLTGDVEIIVNAYQSHEIGEQKTVTVKATCEADGSETIETYCAKCFVKYAETTKVLGKLGHDYEETYTNPTFDADGFYTYTCKNDKTHTYTVQDEGTKLIAVARIGSTRYQTLEEAIAAAARRDTIELLTQVAVEGTQVWDKNITIIIPNSSGYGLLVKGDLTIKAGTFVVDGLYGIGVQPTGKLTIDDGAFEIENDNEYLIGSWGETVINGGEFIGQYCCVNAFKSYNPSVTSKLTITGGTFETDEFDYTGEWESSDVFAEDEDTEVAITGGTFSKSVEWYLAEGYCQVEGRKGFEVAAHIPGEAKEENRKEADCVTAGSYQMVTDCTRCDAELSRVDHEIPATGHTVEVVAGQAPDCTNDGYEEAYYCSVCQKYFATRVSEKELADEITVELSVWQTTEGEKASGGKIAALGHSLKKTDKVPEACEVSGVKEYWQCSVETCGACFEDEAQTKPIADLAAWKAEGGDGFLPALEHSYNEEVTKAPTCTATGIKTFTCKNGCGHSYTEDIDALNHDWLVVYNWNADLTECEAIATCKNNTFEKITEKVTTTLRVDTAAKCEEEGAGAMVATFSESNKHLFTGDEKPVTIAALDHNYTSEVTKQPSCTEEGIKTYTCQNDNTHTYYESVSKIPHNMELVDAVEATCTETGIIEHYQCKSCLGRFYDEAGQQPIEAGKHITAALNHKYDTVVTDPTCNDKGYTTYTCSRGDHTYVDDYVDALGHDYDEGVILEGNEPTCTDKGVKTFTCQRCEEGVAGHIKTEEVSAIGHKAGDPIGPNFATCTTVGWSMHYECQNCRLFFVDKACTKLIGDAAALETWKNTEGENGGKLPTQGHNYIHQSGKTPDCDDAGYKESYFCDRCSLYFADKNGTEIGNEAAWIAWKAEGGTGYLSAKGHRPSDIKTDAVVNATCTVDGHHDEYRECLDCGNEIPGSRVTVTDTAPGHNASITLDAVKQTCTTPGMTEGKKCSVCGEVTVAQITIPADGHDKNVIIPAVEATCTTPGKTEGKKCSVCGEVQVPQSPTATKPHDAETTIVQATCTVDGSVTKVCKDCGHTTTETLKAPGHKDDIVLEAVAPTCTTTGLEEGVKCSVCQTITLEQVVIPALGHTIEETAAVETACDAYGTKAYYYCDTCKEYYATKVSETELTDKIGDQDALDKWLDTIGQGKIDKLPHTSKVLPAVAPTCTETGLTVGSVCSVCGETLLAQSVVNATGHTEVTDKAVAPTCTETGLTEGKHCSVCETVIKAQETVPALGHTIEETAAVEAACNAYGTKAYYYCDTCKQYFATKVSETELADRIENLEIWKNTKGQGRIEMIPHTEVIDEAVAPTCTEKGKTEGKHCSVCETVLVAQNEINEKGHTKETLDEKAPTCTETGLTEGTKCSVCGETLVAQEVVPAKGHTGEFTKGVAAKCELAGWKDYYQCKDCQLFFEDEKCEKPIEDLTAWRTTGAGVIPGLEHNWDKGAETILATCDTDGVKTYACSICKGTKNETVPMLGHIVVEHAGQHPTYYSVGWEPYETCARLNCEYNSMVGIPALGEPSVNTYEDFMASLKILEEYANAYAKANPGKDPMWLLIKYVRTGVDRYNSGSWNIMAGYEDEGFAKYVMEQEEAYNKAVPTVEDMINVTGIKNIGSFELPNGQTVDFGHMFGTMDITYHNMNSINHADVSGWAGDLVDLLSTADRHDVTGTVDEMIKEIGTDYLNHHIEGEDDQFGQTDMYGDLDGYYFMKEIIGKDYEAGMLYGLMEDYFVESLTDEQRADYFLKNRLGGVTGRNEIREAVFSEYLGNSVIATLEGTREFKQTDIADLRKACCYAFADYLCYLAGDYVELGDNPYFSVFSTEMTTLAPGIVQQISKATTADGKQVVYYTATADVNSPYVDVYANYKDNDPSLGWGMQRVLDQANAAQAKYGDPNSEQYIENFNVIAAINGAGYNMTTGEPAGVLMMGGVEYQAPNGGFVGFLTDGSCYIGTDAEYYALKEQGLIRDAISMFGTTLVKDGKIAVTATDNYYTDRASRTAIGYTKTGKVVFMVMDGRQEPVSCGGSAVEIAQVMLEAGCVHAINLDGGGSTTYVARQPGDDALSLVSSPSDGFQRSVSTSLYIASTAPSSTAFDHAVLDSEYRYLTIGATTQVTATGVSATGNPAELPEGATWTVSNATVASISEDGVVTALANGKVDVNLMLGEQIIGTRTLNVVVPDAVYFTQENMNAIYGEPANLPVAALYEGKPVAITEADAYFTLSIDAAGTTEGFTFIGDEASGIKTLKIFAHAVNNPDATSGSMGINMFRADEASFDFANADGGDRLLAYNREVSNSTTADGTTYNIVDHDKDMVTEYTFGMDMTQIPIPEELSSLIYMLPGADVEGNNSAWDFLLQLAERVSVLTNVTATLQLDPRFDVDYSGLSVNCEYFILDKTEFNPETNQLTLSLHWKDQTKAIDPDTANPLVIMAGIKLTPKADADWGTKDRLTAVNTGEISYDIYLRANALYSFASKPENQEAFKLYPFVNPDVIIGGSPESGGHFADVYKTFRDEYTLNKGQLNGWVYEDGGYAYYDDGVKYYGIQKVGQFYYDFGSTGINIGQTKYSGMFQIDGVNYYSREGLLTGGWYTEQDNKYYFDETGKAVDGEITLDEVRLVFDNGLLVGGHTGFLTKANGKTYYYQNGTMYYSWLQLDGKWYCFDETNGAMIVGDGTNATKLFPTNEAKAKGAYYVFNEQGHALYSFPNNYGYYYWADLQAQNQWVLNGNDLEGIYRTNANAHYVTASDASQLFELTLGDKTYTAVKIAIDGVVYTFDNSNGKLLLGSMVYENGQWFYYWAGEPVNDGWFEFQGETYYAYPDGHLATGSVTIDGEDYMFTPQGVLITEGVMINATLTEGNKTLKVKVINANEDMSAARMAIWAVNAGQETTMKWIDLEKDGEEWIADISMCPFGLTEADTFELHVYGTLGETESLIVNTTVTNVAPAEHTYTDAQDPTCDICGFEREIIEEPEQPEQPEQPESIATTPMYRLFNPNTGEHFYTGSTEERDMLVEAGWNYEGVAWNAPIYTGAPVYRVFNPNSGDHHYTMSQEEVDMLVELGWQYEGVAWNSAPANHDEAIGQFRLYNPNADIGSHHYTSSTEERDFLVSLGWIFEGMGWFGMLK